jgi:hypothetical protein
MNTMDAMENRPGANTDNARTPSHNCAQEEDLNEIENRFACNICLDSVKTPVVTRCGHLYCWPCLYMWLEPGMTTSERRFLDSSYVERGPVRAVDVTRRSCPVCKSPCSIKEVIPIYVQEHTPKQDQPQEQRHSNATDAVKGAVDQGNHEHGRNNGEAIEANTSSVDVNVEDSPNLDMNTRINISEDIPVDTGLRRRRTQSQTQTQTQPSQLQMQTISTDNVPSRPLPPPSTTPPITQHNRPHTTTTTNIQAHNNSALALHQSLFQALLTVQTHPHSPPAIIRDSQQQHSPSSQGNSNNNYGNDIPSLHDRGSNSNRNGTSINANGDYHNGQYMEENSQDDTSEFLSRLLLLLGSFVILCLLLF